MKLHDLKSPEGSTHRKKIVGRGIGGKGGKTAGRGTKGTKARGQVATGFEGGQMPLQRRVPKLRGFSNLRFKTTYQVVNTGRLAELYPQGGDVTPEDLDQVLLAREASRDEHVGVDVTDPQRDERVEVDGRVLHAKGIRETLQLGDALEQRQLAALEARGDLAAGLLTLGTAARGLAALAANTTPDDLLAVRRAFG